MVSKRVNLISQIIHQAMGPITLPPPFVTFGMRLGNPGTWGRAKRYGCRTGQLLSGKSLFTSGFRKVPVSGEVGFCIVAELPGEEQGAADLITGIIKL
ncbi:hypothetical protein [Mucilaginibacter sp.]|jgi:hypothetical protein|uniref:hypothetical protein n=1 Tax=Mucilaginibacter sp. TaxID=1882438 RepID=UPI00356413D9